MSRTFTAKADAVTWARLQEHTIEVGGLPLRMCRGLTLASLLDRYETEVIPLKRTDSTERNMLSVLRRHPMSQKALNLLTAEDVADFRDKRLQAVRPATVVRHLRVLRHALRIAQDEWGWSVPLAEVRKVRLPQVLLRHTDRVSDNEIGKLICATEAQSNPHISMAIKLALATGMRRGELLNLSWHDVDVTSRRALVRMSKNGRSRIVPLTTEACHLLEGGGSGSVLPISQNCLRMGFDRARRKAGTSFRFHDLRHEAISRLFEAGLTVPEVQLVSGHRTLSQLGRYSHPDVERIARVLGSRPENVGRAGSSGVSYGITEPEDLVLPD